MKRYHLLFILFFSICIFSCRKKEYPESVAENSPPFYFQATIDNVPVNLAAGIDDYYMYSSFQQSSNNVYSLVADMRKAGCNNCPNSLYLSINDSKVSAPNASIDIDSALQIKSYPLQTGPSYSVQFQSFYNKTAASYLWDFGDGSTSTVANPQHIYSKQGKYNVSLTVNGTNSCVGNISNIQKIGFSSSVCTASIKDTAQGNTISFSSTLQGTPPFSYLWSFGDGTFSTQANPVHTYTLPGGYPVSLRVIDSNNDTAYAKYNTITQSDVSSCSANYKVTSVSPAINLPDLSGILVQWRDASGILYSSANYQQPSSSYFQIVSIEDFERNEKGELTKKIKVKFKCSVFNGNSVKVIDNVEATVCVSYK